MCKLMGYNNQSRLHALKYEISLDFALEHQNLQMAEFV